MSTNLQAIDVNSLLSGIDLLRVEDVGGSTMGYMYVPQQNVGLIMTELQKRGLIAYKEEHLPFCAGPKDLPAWYGYDH